MPYKEHLDGLEGCVTRKNNLVWNDSIICSSSTNMKVMDVLINNPVPTADFNAQTLKLLRLDIANEERNLSLHIDSEFTHEDMIIIKKSQDTKLSFATPFITNQIYNVHWKYGIDFEHFGVFASEYWRPDMAGIVLRFNYSAFRETYDISKNIGGVLTA